MWLGIAAHLGGLDKGFAKIAPSRFEGMPIVIGESVPDGCAACRARN